MSAISETYNCDCYEYMRTLPDKFFDLVIADPPYGIAADARQQNRANKRHGNAAAASRDYGTAASWDLQAPAKEVFDEIFRVSRHQVIFGANHFISRMPYDASCWLVWDKDNGNNGYADCELAWTSFPSAVRKYRYTWHGMIQEDMKHKEQRIHPTQKPVALYRWLIETYLPKIGGVKSSTRFSVAAHHVSQRSVSTLTSTAASLTRDITRCSKNASSVSVSTSSRSTDRKSNNLHYLTTSKFAEQ